VCDHRDRRPRGELLKESDFAPLGAVVHAGDRFGASLAAGHYYTHTNAAIDDLIIGAPGYRVAGVANAGAAFVYRGWGAPGARQPTAQDMFPDPAPTAGPDGFGAAVAMGNLDGTHGAIAVGAPSGAKFTVRNGEVWTRNAPAAGWTFGLGFDEHIVHGVQPQSAPPLTCTLQP
jgi:hypothetical protein